MGEGWAVTVHPIVPCSEKRGRFVGGEGGGWTHSGGGGRGAIFQI